MVPAGSSCTEACTNTKFVYKLWLISGVVVVRVLETHLLER